MYARIILIALLTAQVRLLIEECGKITSSSTKDEFPWNVGIYMEEGTEPPKLICLGSIIQSNVILTAAHCVCETFSGQVRNNLFYVSTGRVSSKIDLTNENVQKVSKNNIIPNGNFNGFLNFLSDDIAVLKLPRKIKFSAHIRPVCVDWGNTLEDVTSSGKISFWNETTVHPIDQDYVNDDECESIASALFKSYITPDKFCARSRVIPINGDIVSTTAGAGLVYLNAHDNLWYIQGVASAVDLEQSQLITATKLRRYLNWLSNICARL